MAVYYYILSSLPMLQFSQKLPLSYADFLASYSESVSEADRRCLQSLERNFRFTLDPDDGEGHLITRQWNEFVHDVTSELAHLRIIKARKESEHHQHEDKDIYSMVLSGEVVDGVRTVFSMDDPLSSEMALLKLYWDKADSLRGSHAFDSTSLLVYAIQLRILERKELFDPLEGNQEFKRLFHDIQTTIKSI